MALKGLEKSLDSHLWHACAGGMVQMPPLNSKVVFFPQGYAEHAQGNVEFGSSLKIPSLILCRVDAIKYLADPETDEVFAKLGLVPLRCVGGNLEGDDGDDDDNGVVVENNGIEGFQKPVSFAKTLTQSDANNGGGFSVPRYCAETIFPRLDYRAEPPVQTILAKDVHGETWKFRHIYRGTPRRHLLTTGWSNFVNRKKLIAGDSIVFLRAENGDLCVGIRRAKRGINGGYSLFWREDESNFLQANSNWCSGERGKVTGESVVEAAALAAIGRPFEAVYYTRGSSPEFCVKASAVRAAMRVQWGCGMRFKMAFETEDSSRVSWFMGAISSVQVADPVRWPNSPWRLLQVTWDEPDLLQNVKRVSPWLVEVVSNVPAIHLSPFSPPRKKLRLPQHPDFSLLGQLPVPLFPHINPLRPSTPFCYNPPSIQGARHSHVGLFSPRPLTSCPNNTHDENTSCLLTMGNSNPTLSRNSQEKTQPLPQFVLFGQPILTEEQISQSCSNDTNGRSVSDGSTERTANTEETPFYKDHENTKMGTDMGHRKVFMESENAGRVLDLPVGSYEELYRKIADVWHKKIRDAEEYAAMGQGGGYC